jgi:hypothetical protein
MKLNKGIYMMCYLIALQVKLHSLYHNGTANVFSNMERNTTLQTSVLEKSALKLSTENFDSRYGGQNC